jgi:hypothetical protein
MHGLPEFENTGKNVDFELSSLNTFAKPMSFDADQILTILWPDQGDSRASDSRIYTSYETRKQALPYEPIPRTDFPGERRPQEEPLLHVRQAFLHRTI